MSGREAAVGAGLFILAAGILADQANSAPAAPKPVPVPTHTVIIHQITEHTVTRVVSGSPVSGWQLMFIVIAALVISAGTVITLHIHRRPE